MSKLKDIKNKVRVKVKGINNKIKITELHPVPVIIDLTAVKLPSIKADIRKIIEEMYIEDNYRLFCFKIAVNVPSEDLIPFYDYIQKLEVPFYKFFYTDDIQLQLVEVRGVKE